jgi:hypothetical protein
MFSVLVKGLYIGKHFPPPRTWGVKNVIKTTREPAKKCEIKYEIPTGEKFYTPTPRAYIFPLLEHDIIALSLRTVGKWA